MGLFPGVCALVAFRPGYLAAAFTLQGNTVAKMFYWPPSKGKAQAKPLACFQEK